VTRTGTKSLKFPDLRSYLSELQKQKELVRIEAEVDADQEIAEIHRRVIAAQGPALLFTNVRNSGFPVVTNLFGSSSRVELAFGRDAKSLIAGLVDLVTDGFPPPWSRLWRSRKTLAPLLRLGTRRVRKGPVTEVVTDRPALNRLPALTCWPEDGGPFLTLPMVYTEHPEGRGSNLGMYRLQIHDAATTGMHWQIGKGGGYHYALAESRDQSLPATVFLGGPPALMPAAIAPLPENVPELLLASLVAGRRIPCVEGIGPHPIPATAEFALVGNVPSRVRRPEGPFGDHYGYYSLTHDFPVFEVARMAHRREAVYPATVVGKPRQEDFYIGDFLQELLKPLFPLVMPNVIDLWSYGETGYHSLAAAVITERYRREAMTAAFRILGEGQLSLTKFLLVTDARIDLRDFPQTLTHILARTRTESDLYVFSNLAMDTLDYSGPALNEGSKGVWLGIGEPVRELPREFSWSGNLPDGLTAVRVFCPGCLVLGGPAKSDRHGAAADWVKHPAFADWPLLILSDEPERTARSSVNFLWSVFTRFEPAADLHAARVEIRRNHLCYRAPILIDARKKPGFPGELFCSPEIASRVTRRWKEYFPDGMEMGSSDEADLT